ncbi:MAG: CHAT domain-containing protein [Symploca sp. SIO1C2]|nr:CHAT domain-containing protein [Symploca sp. SIO1C2]
MARKWRLLILRVQFSFLRAVRDYFKILSRLTRIDLLRKSRKGEALADKNSGFMGNQPAPMLLLLRTMLRKRPYRPFVISRRVLLFIFSALFGFTSALSLPALSAYQIVQEQEATSQNSNAWRLVQKAQELSEASEFEETEKVWLEAAQSFLIEGCQQENMLKSLINRAEALRTLGFDRTAFNTLVNGLQFQAEDCQATDKLIQNQPNYLSQSDFLEKDDLAEQLANLLQDKPSSPTEAQALHSLGKVLRELGNFPEALKVLQKSLQYAQNHQSLSLDEGAILLDIGNTQVSVGQEKINQQESSEELIRQLALRAQLKKKKITTLRDILTSFDRCEVDQVDEANQETCNSVIGGGYYQWAIDSYQQAERPVSFATTQLKAKLNRLSLLIDIQTTLNQAINKAKEIGVQKKPPEKLISTYLQWDSNIKPKDSNIKPRLDEELKGLISQVDQELSFQINQETPLSKSNIDLLLNFTDLLTKDTTSQAIDQESLSRLSFLPALEQILEKDSNYADTLTSIDARSQVLWLGNVGKIYEQQKAYDQAQYYTELALNVASNQGKPSEPYITYILRWQLGRIFKAQENLKAARNNYELAFKNLEILRQDIAKSSKNLQFNFKDELEPIYRDLVGLLLPEKSYDTTATKSIAQTQAATEDNNTKDIKKAIEVIESLRLAELENYFQDPCALEEQAKVDIDTLLDNNEQASSSAIIYPIVLEDQENMRLVVLLKLPGEPITYYENDTITKSEFNKNLEDLRNFIYTNSRNIVKQKISLQDRVIALRDEEATREETLQQPLQKLYDWLIRPIETNLQDFPKGTLVFVPDSKLRNVPLAALHDGERYLIEKYSVALLPGLKLTNTQPWSKKDPKVLLGGNEKSLVDGTEIKLTAVERELTEIEQVFPKGELLWEKDFTRKKLEEELKSSFDIVHLATHSKFEPDVENTFIQLWDNKTIKFQEFEDLLKERSFDPIQLLVLNSCETSTGNDRAVLGLAGVAVRTGVSSTVATLWPVEDQTAAEVMIKFYQELADNPDLTLAEALRQAQLNMLDNTFRYKFREEEIESQEKEIEYEPKHPIFWAGYVVVGNWL